MPLENHFLMLNLGKFAHGHISSGQLRDINLNTLNENRGATNVYISDDNVINYLNTTLEENIIPSSTLDFIGFEDQLELVLVPFVKSWIQ